MLVGASDNVKETEQSVSTSQTSNNEESLLQSLQQDEYQAPAFFESLQLHSTKHQSEEIHSKDDRTTEKLEDVSFFESIGLYWVNPADKHEPVPENNVKDTAPDNIVINEAVSDNIDNEFDFFNMLGLVPSSSSSGAGNKKWRLWNPDMDSSWVEDDLYRDLELPDHPDPSSTDPTIMEHSSPPGVKVRNQSQKMKSEEVELNIHSRPKRVVKQSKIFEIEESRPKKMRIDILPETDSIANSHNSQEKQANYPPDGGLITCPSCEARVLPRQFGKHLVSHYHYHRSLGHQDSERLILDNIQDIVHQSPFQCRLCSYYCNYHDQLVNHVRNHPPEIQSSETFWCQVCMKIIPDHDHLVSHLNNYSHTELVTVINRSVPVIIKKISLVSCSVCDKQFRYNISLKKHMKLVHYDEQFELENHEKFFCSDCSFYSYKRKALKIHNFLIHPNPKLKYDCYICKQQFISKATSTAHRNSATHKLNSELHKMMEENMDCNHCPEHFLDEEDLRKHIETSHVQELSQCHLCGNMFHFPQELTLHLKLRCQTQSTVSTTAAARLKCALCSLPCVNNSVLTLHVSGHHSSSTSDSGQHHCPLCQVPVSQHQLLDHVQYHGGDLHHCQHCHQLFTNEYKFNKHSQVCNVVYKCNLCSYSSKKKILLNLHIKRSHSNNTDEPEIFLCNVCNTQFTKKTSLSKHMMTHKEKIPKFHCSQCDFKALFKSDLERHLVKHSVSKEIKCSECSFVCKRKNELVRHNKLVHQDSPINACNFCEYKTKNIDHLKRHVERRHRLNEMTCLEVVLDENDLIKTVNSTSSVPEFVTEQIVINS